MKDPYCFVHKAANLTHNSKLPLLTPNVMAVFCQSLFAECYNLPKPWTLISRTMSINQRLGDLVGEWKGTNRLHTPWMPEPLKESDSRAAVRSKMNGQFLSIEYAWSFEGEKQEGMLILGCDPKSDAVQAVWTDSWHSKDVLMLCNGAIDDDERISVIGHYSVPENPDWGWRTEIVRGTDSFRYAMYNVSPDGVEEIAVETDFERA